MLHSNQSYLQTSKTDSSKHRTKTKWRMFQSCTVQPKHDASFHCLHLSRSNRLEVGDGGLVSLEVVKISVSSARVASSPSEPIIHFSKTVFSQSQGLAKAFHRSQAVRSYQYDLTMSLTRSSVPTAKIQAISTPSLINMASNTMTSMER